MSLMWLAMGAMFILDCVMIYLHIRLHKMVKSGSKWSNMENKISS